MWLIFLAVFLGLVFLGLVIWWIGSKIYISIQREQKKFEIEEAGYDGAKEKIKKSMEEKEL